MVLRGIFVKICCQYNLSLTHCIQKTSEWTLDYPPFFAYFEWALSRGARYADKAMLQISNLNHDSWQTIHYQRATVLLTELVLVYALHLYVCQGSQVFR
jgi:alpha-1,3-glucosyltransferase